MVEIKGLEKLAPKDFPGFISATFFTGGCNLRCPFCHNVDLVLNPGKLRSYPWEFVIGFLDSRKEWLEAVCVSGGEPLMHPDIEMLFQILKDRDLLTKLDTNGFFPERLQDLIDTKLLDYVALDIKAALRKYPEAVAVEADVSLLDDSIKILRTAPVKTIFRTTAVPGLIDEEDIVAIGEWLAGADSFWLQQFFPENTLDKSYQELKPYSKEKMQALGEIAEKYFQSVKLEGI